MLYINVDGVLNDYPESYIWFLNKKFKKNFSDLNEAKMNIPYKEYTEARSEYRFSHEIDLQPRKAIIYILNTKSLFSNILITKRPIYAYTHLNNLFTFLRKSKIKYEHLCYWNKDLADPNIPFEIFNCHAAIEDNFKIANFLSAKFTIKSFVLINKNNEQYIKTAVEGVSYGDANCLKLFLEKI